MPELMYCENCGRWSRITEFNSFRGADKLRSTLACGHVVLHKTGSDSEGDKR